MKKYFDEIMKRIKHGRSNVVGLGRSNYPLIDHLLKIGAKDIVARDKNHQDSAIVERYERLGVRFVTGEGYLSDLGGEDSVIFRTPAVKPFTEELRIAAERGAIISSEMELYLMLTPSVKIGITGSDGKTTTTTLIHKMLSLGHDARAGGNIGNSLLPSLDDTTEDSFSVLELSSFQLMGINAGTDIAVITNISPNHLDWHNGMEEYVEAKSRLISGGVGRVVFNADNAETVGAIKRHGGDCELIAFSSTLKSLSEIDNVIQGVRYAVYLENGWICVEEKGGDVSKVLDTSVILIPGAHNVENYMAAIGATLGLVTSADVRRVAEEFGGVAHRLELVRIRDGVKYYNSSIDSSPTRTEAALSALKEKPIVICGGSDKNIPFEPLAVALCGRAKAVVITGAAGEKIKKALLECPLLSASGLIIAEEKRFKDAVLLACNMAKYGDTVLLSPACASFDEFKNFEERGNLFKSIIESLN